MVSCSILEADHYAGDPFLVCLIAAYLALWIGLETLGIYYIKGIVLQYPARTLEEMI